MIWVIEVFDGDHWRYARACVVRGEARDWMQRFRAANEFAKFRIRKYVRAEK